MGPFLSETEFGRLMKQPDEIGGAETQSGYVVVNDADAVYARAKAAGARIAIEIKDEDYGGRAFSCYDLEGHSGASAPMTHGDAQPPDAADRFRAGARQFLRGR